MKCPHCYKKGVVKSGNYEGKQRYKCKSCKRTFTSGIYSGGNGDRGGRLPKKPRVKGAQAKKIAVTLFCVAALLLFGVVSMITTGDFGAAVFGIVAAAVCAFFGYRLYKKPLPEDVQANDEEPQDEQ